MRQVEDTPQIEQRSEKQRKIPLDVVPLESRRITYWQLKSGEVLRSALNPELLAAVDEYDPADPRDNPPAKPAVNQPPSLSAAQERRRENFRELVDGPSENDGRTTDNRRRVCSVPARLRAQPQLDW